MHGKPLSEQVVVVTGASSGVGRAVARIAGERGARVVLSGRNEQALHAAVAEVEAAGGVATAFARDLAEDGAPAALVAAAVARFGRVDSVVACAFVSLYAEVEHVEPDELRRVLEVNFVARALCYVAALPELRRTRGAFVDVNSALAYRGVPLQAPYCASKAAMRAFLEAARVEEARAGTGVAISVVLPGGLNTPHFDRVRQKWGLQPQPVPPVYEPEVVARAALRMCERPVRELPVGFAAQKVLWGQKASPRSVDVFLRRTGWKSQTTGEPKPVDAPDNLWESPAGDPGAHGRFGEGARRSALWTELRLRRRSAAAVAALGAALGLATMVLRSRA